MKSSLIVVLVALAGFTQAVELNKVLHDECAKQENLTPEEMAKMPTEDGFKNPSKNMKCFHKCLMESLGVMKDGKLIEDKITSDISRSPEKDKLGSQFAICKAVEPAADPCDTAFNYFTCMLKPFMP